MEGETSGPISNEPCPLLTVYHLIAKICQPLVMWQSGTIVSCVILPFSRLSDGEKLAVPVISVLEKNLLWRC